MFSILLEGTSEPRWRPDWLSGKHLAADAFGRVDNALKKIPADKQPAAWVERVAKAREWISVNNIDLFCVLPAIGESARRKPPIQSETLGLKPYFDAFSADPNIDTLLTYTPALYIAGVTAEAQAACRTVMAQLQKASARWDEQHTRYVLQTLSFVAVQTQDEGLADSVAEFCVEKTRELSDGEFYDRNSLPLDRMR